VAAPSEEELLVVLSAAYRAGFTVASDFARARATVVAAAASLGLLTTYVPRTGFTRTWRCTVKGVEYLEES